MKYLIILLLLFAGCAQVIVKTPQVTVKVNTLLKDIAFDKLWLGSIFELQMYKGESVDVTLVTPPVIFKSGGSE